MRGVWVFPEFWAFLQYRAVSLGGGRAVCRDDARIRQVECPPECIRLFQTTTHPIEESMNMNKGEFVEALADRLDVPRAQAERAVAGVLEIISEQLAKGEKVTFTGFGSFEVSQRASRTGRNPRTGDTIKIAASNVPKFSAGATLKALVNK
jgi:DNA-binding protein HU-beta